MFKRIYSSFGSSAPYSIFPDSRPFLRWARHQGIIVGIVSNAEYRYQDVILPSLGLHKVLTSNTFYIDSIHSLKAHSVCLFANIRVQSGTLVCSLGSLVSKNQIPRYMK